jgi:hypothetical protein
VGASLLAMVVNDNAGCLNACGAWTFFASKLAPTAAAYNSTARPAGRPPRDALAVHAPSRGRVEVLRSGQTGMDAGLAAAGHGWPMAAGPRSRTGARACRAIARHRTKGAKPFGYFGPGRAGPKVTRRKGGTVSGRYRNNGYVHQQEQSRPGGRHREQARSHKGYAQIRRP